MNNKQSPLLIFHVYKKIKYPKKSLLKLAQTIYLNEKIPFSKKTHLILCSNYKIKKLNATFRNKNHVTDVLSFNFNDKDLLGEIYISLQRAKQQAKIYKVSYYNEIKRLFVHGLFHLLGYDHETEKDKIKMNKKESKYI